PPRGQRWRPYYTALGYDSWRAAQQLGLAVILLPDQALLAVDAVVRTLTRVFVSHRRMLEWQTASQVERTTGNSRLSVWKRMWPAVVLGIALLGIVAWHAWTAGPESAMSWLAGAALIVLAVAWVVAPETAIALSAPLMRHNHALRPDERATTLRYALRHWRYFDRFVTAETHWLVPDNFQETPEPVIATRTSPTNIGLQLLATMSAYDLGFLTRVEMLDRLDRAFDSMDRMSRVRGHFYNW